LRPRSRAWSPPSAAPTEDDQAHGLLLLEQRLLQIAVALADIDLADTGGRRALTQAGQKLPAPLPGLAGALLVLGAELVEELLLRVEADGAAVVLPRGRGLVAVDDVQELQRRPMRRAAQAAASAT
jgi:hypothetical protein